MKRITFRAAIALLTFAVGVSATTLWIVHSKSTKRKAARTTQHGTTEPRITAPAKPNGATLEMVFVLDTTGSMSGLIEGAKQRIWGIVNEVMQSPAHPSVRIGLVGYRDRGDQYVTQVLPLTDDLDKVYATLMNFRADGGGDTPENVRRALADGVARAGWSQQSSRGANVAQIIFLVGDAPPHEDYQDEPDTLKTTQQAVERGMIVNTIQCGEQADTRQHWQQIARRGEGQFFAIAQDGGVASIASPYDDKLSELGAKLGGTFTAYGGGGGAKGEAARTEMTATQASMETNMRMSAPKAAAADRALNKALNTRAYANDLLQDLENGTLKIDSLKDENLSEDLRKLGAAERRREIERRLEERRKLRAEIVALAKQRDTYIAAERQKRSGGQTGFDAAVASALKAQMARKGIR